MIQVISVLAASIFDVAFYQEVDVPQLNDERSTFEPILNLCLGTIRKLSNLRIFRFDFENLVN